MYPDPQRRRFQPDFAQQPVTTATFGSGPQLPQLPDAAPMAQPPAGINVPQLQGIATGVMDRFFKPKPIGSIGGKLKGIL